MSAVITQEPPQRERISTTTLLVILGSETAFFGTLIMAYLATRSGHTDWPFANPSLPRLVVPGLNTLLLILSMVCGMQAVKKARERRPDGVKWWLTITMGLGLVFVAGQIFEFSRLGLRPDDPAFGGAFFALMGFHALHILAGEVFHGLNLIRAWVGDFDAGDYVAVQTGAWFWTFVVGVWLLLFMVLYIV